MGIAIRPEELLTPSQLARDFLLINHSKLKPRKLFNWFGLQIKNAHNWMDTAAVAGAKNSQGDVEALRWGT